MVAKSCTALSSSFRAPCRLSRETGVDGESHRWAGSLVLKAPRPSTLQLLYEMRRKFPLDDIDRVKIPLRPGIYKIYSRFPFPRLKGKTDVLYIGRASGKKGLRGRLMTFPKGFKALDAGRPYRKRQAIKRFWKLKKAGFKLYFSYMACRNPKREERRELQDFETIHLEIPPLNHRL